MADGDSFTSLGDWGLIDDDEHIPEPKNIFRQPTATHSESSNAHSDSDKDV